MQSDSLTPPITVMLVDDHPLFLEGLVSMLRGQSDLQVVAEAGSVREAIERHRAVRPDITLMDVELGEQQGGMDGIDALAAIRAEQPAARIIVLTTYRGDMLARRAIAAGAAGYLLKSTLRRELAATIRAVHAGQRCIPPEVAAGLVTHFDTQALSEREIQVIRLIAAGSSNKRIAQQLDITEETVKTHIRNLMAKMSARDRTHAVTIALERGIISMNGISGP